MISGCCLGDGCASPLWRQHSDMAVAAAAAGRAAVSLLQLPDEMLCRIIVFLPLPAVAAAARSCRRLCALCMDEAVWRCRVVAALRDRRAWLCAQDRYLIQSAATFREAFRSRLWPVAQMGPADADPERVELSDNCILFRVYESCLVMLGGLSAMDLQVWDLGSRRRIGLLRPPPGMDAPAHRLDVTRGRCAVGFCNGVVCIYATGAPGMPLAVVAAPEDLDGGGAIAWMVQWKGPRELYVLHGISVIACYDISADGSTAVRRFSIDANRYGVNAEDVFYMALADPYLVTCHAHEYIKLFEVHGAVCTPVLEVRAQTDTVCRVAMVNDYIISSGYDGSVRRIGG